MKRSSKKTNKPGPVEEKVFVDGAKAWLGVSVEFARAMYSLYLDVYDYSKEHSHSEVMKLLKGIVKQTIENGAVMIVSASLSFIFGALRGDVLTRNEVMRLNEYKQDVWWEHYFSEEALLRTVKQNREENAARRKAAQEAAAQQAAEQNTQNK